MRLFPAEERRKILAIDSKSFYASVEAIEAGLNPLTAVLVVMSTAENAGKGLILAASPMAKKLFGISNVSRAYEVPVNDPRLVIKEPRMNYYIAVNKRVNDIFRAYVADEDLHIYSIDESFLDVTDSWTYLCSQYGADLTLKKLARIIQQRLRQEIGLYLSVGVGDNLTMAKLALDLEAKGAHDLFAEWHFEDVPKKLWPIKNLDQVWSIGSRTAKRLHRLGLMSMRDLALADPTTLQAEFGVKGEALFALAWGIDRSRITEKHGVKQRSLSNGQVLPRNYQDPLEIKNVIREMAEQIAARLRAEHLISGQVTLTLGGSWQNSTSVRGQFGLSPTNQTSKLVVAFETIFEQIYQGQSIRNIYVAAQKVQANKREQLDLFVDYRQDDKQKRLDQVVDMLRKQYGVTAIIKSNSLGAGGTMLSRAGLVGGHRGGNAYG
ncbi:possible DNA-directed DNA polymerase [Weissella oryzae SG25]|uniref:Possible DNA-directed DNA polymerase n=1 Tax=Weissella oryzae (strain DSM 25784 / JCM 18191 / LMG 30913 / SG25) TaxID=1329250 RepID=A0A069D2J3_WEIOS|nr:excinuclease ABC subunit A [Weissella oryzae]GAK31646.1 possible DNA-directed DNA polymerase [Weissella oryzae SG25]